MLRKANETKRQIIESLNKRLMNESESLDSRIESIVKDSHKEMEKKLTVLFQTSDGTGLVGQRFNDEVINKIHKSEDTFLKFLLSNVQKEMDRMKSKREQ